MAPLQWEFLAIISPWICKMASSLQIGARLMQLKHCLPSGIYFNALWKWWPLICLKLPLYCPNIRLEMCASAPINEITVITRHNAAFMFSIYISDIFSILFFGIRQYVYKYYNGSYRVLLQEMYNKLRIQRVNYTSNICIKYIYANKYIQTILSKLPVTLIYILINIFTVRCLMTFTLTAYILYLV